MNRFLAEDFRALSDTLESIVEEEPKDDESETPEGAVTDLMTKEKGPEKLEGSISIKSLAADLGLQNVGEFQAAFNMLRQGMMPTKNSHIRELAMAFDKLLAADASTTSRVLTRLRQIHKAPVTNA